jgi:serine/threonine protein kinase
MALTCGTKLGPFEIRSPLGAGGMGEVYRAADSKLGRDVALKVILPEFPQDVQLMARFHREAQVLASLNHTNIASIYGLEESGGVRALVMELVEGQYDFGQTLSIPNYDVTRDGRFIMLRRGPQGSSLHVVIHWAEELKQILAAGGVR